MSQRPPELPPQWRPQQPNTPYPPQQWQQQPYYQPPQTPYPLPYQQPWPPPPMQPLPKKRMSAGKIVLIAVGVLVLACVSCGLIGVLGAHSMPTATTSAPTQAIGSTQATPTVSPATVATSRPTAIPTRLPPTPKPTPLSRQTPIPTRAPTPTPKPSTGIDGNPWGYNFNSAGGSLITNPPVNFCNYFPCIATFWAADDPDGGYVVQCADGDFSQSGGESGSCSHHGGDSQPLYSH